MTNHLKYGYLVLLFALFANNLFAQLDSTKTDNIVVKQEMGDMLTKLNAFLAQNSTEGANANLYHQLNANINLYKDSINKVIAAQQQAIIDLRAQIETLKNANITKPEVVNKKFENLVGVLYFEVGSSDLTEENKAIVKKVIAEHGDKILQIVSYTDWTGNNEINQKLSDKRALSVQNELTNNGFLIQNLKTYSRGKMAQESTNLSAKECRRVEIRY